MLAQASYLLDRERYSEGEAKLRVDRDFIRLGRDILTLKSDRSGPKCQHRYRICTRAAAQYEFFDTTIAPVLWIF